MYYIQAIIDDIPQYYCGSVYKDAEIEFNVDANIATEFSTYFIVYLKIKEIKSKTHKYKDIKDIKIINVNTDEVAI